MYGASKASWEIVLIIQAEALYLLSQSDGFSAPSCLKSTCTHNIYECVKGFGTPEAHLIYMSDQKRVHKCSQQ